MSTKISPEQWATMSPAQKFANATPEKQEEILKGIDPAELEHVWDEWWARPNQVIPEDPYYPIHLLLTGRGWGKALPLDTPIATPSGWTTMGQLTPGDYVYDEKGQPTKVTAVHPSFTPQEGNMYRVHFDGDNYQDACGDHQWTVVDYNYVLGIKKRHYYGDLKLSDVDWAETELGQNRPKTVTTEDLFNEPYYYAQGYAGERRHNYYIGRSQALQGTYTTPSMPEYTLGALIPTMASDELPYNMLRSLPSQRWEMVQGLTDVHGRIHNIGSNRGQKIRYKRFPSHVKDYILELITSLGFEARREYKNPKYTHEFVEWVPHSINPFRHSQLKHALRLRNDIPFRSMFHTIRKVEKIKPVEVRCITVDSPSSLYLAGKAMVPTHNTRTMAEWVRRQAVNYPGCRIGILGRTAADVRDVMALGEALALDTEIATPEGFTTMKDIQVGDTVIGGNGKPCKVTKVYPILENRPVYEMDISGQKVVADENHKWLTEDATYRLALSKGSIKPRSNPEVRTTGEIKNTLRKYNRTNHSIRNTIVEGEPTQLPIDPYLLGYWLGDGDSDGARISVHKDDEYNIWDAIIEAGYTPTRGKKKYKVNITNGFRSALVSNDLLRNKHIPEEYFRSSVEDRLQLIRGLLDSDGSIYPNGYAEFSNNNTILIDGIYELLSSVGIRASIQSPDSTDNISVVFGTSQPVFRLERKLSRIRASNKNKQESRYITSVEPIDSVPVRCIEVDSDDHTFLITRSFIRTHNSGVLAVGPEEERPEYKPSQRTLEWPNGSKATMFSAETPDQLRGQQFHFFACDELAAYTQFVGADGLTAFQNIRIACRLGERPYGVVATTPKRTDVIRELLEEAKSGKVRVVRGATRENAALSSAYKDTILGQFKGTALEKQELEGEMLDDFPEGALWTEEIIDPARINSQAPPLSTGGIIIAVDPSVAETPKDECGIIAIGFTNHRQLHQRHAFVLEDGSMLAKPEDWAKKVSDMYNRWGASAVIVETNQGRSLLTNLMHTINPHMRIIGVNASQGKKLRAEPTILPYQQGRVHHFGKLAQLESQMTTWEPEFTKKSPDRIDALVHGITATLIKPPPELPMARARSSNPANRSINLDRGAGKFSKSPRQMNMRRSR